MDWRDIASAVGKAAPMLGTLLTGPAGAAVAVGGMIASALGTGAAPDEVAQALATNPDAAVRLRQIEADNRVQLQGLTTDLAKAELAAVVQTSGDVNKTMQAEAAAEHWPTYTWRPFIGFAVGVNLIASTLLVVGVFLAMCLNASGAEKAVAALPAALGALAALVALASPILGIASWFRGKAQADPNVPTINRG